MNDNNTRYACEACGTAINISDAQDRYGEAVICLTCGKTQLKYVPSILLFDFENMDIHSWKRLNENPGMEG
jgi:hypothetical protein